MIFMIFTYLFLQSQGWGLNLGPLACLSSTTLSALHWATGSRAHGNLTLTMHPVLLVIDGNQKLLPGARESMNRSQSGCGRGRALPLGQGVQPQHGQLSSLR